MRKPYGILAETLAAQGRNGDTELAHINPQEAELLTLFGGSGTINPRSGLREYYYGGGGADNSGGMGDPGGGDGSDHSGGKGPSNTEGWGGWSSGKTKGQYGQVNKDNQARQAALSRARAQIAEDQAAVANISTEDDGWGFDLGNLDGIIGGIKSHGPLGYGVTDSTPNPSDYSGGIDGFGGLGGLGPPGNDRGGPDQPFGQQYQTSAPSVGDAAAPVEEPAPTVLSPWDYQQQKWAGNNFILAPLTRQSDV
jgi:hypothetical protein